MENTEREEALERATLYSNIGIIADVLNDLIIELKEAGLIDKECAGDKQEGLEAVMERARKALDKYNAELTKRKEIN